MICFLYAATAWRRYAPSIDGVVLLCPLLIVDENNDNGDNDHIPSMIVAIEDVVGMLSKFLAVPSTYAKGAVTTTAVTAWTLCNNDSNR